MKNLAELQDECAALGIKVETNGRSSKEPYVAALRDFIWKRDHGDKPLPRQIHPMLLGSWEDFDEDETREIEQDCHAWIAQPKLDGVRSLLHYEDGRVRITGRTVSDVTYRLSEFQDNLPHLTKDLSRLNGTILDGELVCPSSCLDTGSTITSSSLQATTAILATSPDNARRIQQSQDAYIRFHLFDILFYCGRNLTSMPLVDRQHFLEKALWQADNPFIETVPSFVVNKPSVHHRIIAASGEGTVWKRADGIYDPGRRVGHWIKRKRGIEVEAFVTSFKPGTNGHAHLVGALEFSVRQADGSTTPIAWVSNLEDSERRTMTQAESEMGVRLHPGFIGKRAIISGQGLSARAKRIRHARLVRWLDLIDD